LKSNFDFEKIMKCIHCQGKMERKTAPFQIKAKDNVDNTASWITGYFFKYDNIKPITIAESPDSSGSLTFTIDLNANDKGGSGLSGIDVRVRDGTVDWTDWKTNYVGISADYTGKHGHTYHFEAVATDSAGNKEKFTGIAEAITVVDTTALARAPFAITKPASDIHETSATLNGTVNPNNSVTMVYFEFGETTIYGNTITAEQSSISGTNNVFVSAKLTGLSSNKTYHYQVVAKNVAGTRQGGDQVFITYSSTLTLSHKIQFPNRTDPSDYESTDYRIVGLPGASNIPVTELLPGSPKTDWQVYWDNGKSDNYLIEYNGDPTFNFTEGRAFWIIHKGDLDINRTVSSAPIDSNGYINIEIHPGWNLLTNPLLFSIPWTTIKSLNNDSEPLWFFSKNYSYSSNFDPYSGYYWFNDSDDSLLKIPFNPISSASISSNYYEFASLIINITLSSCDIVDKTTSLGISNKASMALDNLDFRKPRTIVTIPTIIFHRPEWDPNYSNFATDIRPEFEEIESWDFEVRGVHQQNSQLDFKGIEQIPEQMEIYLVDEGRGKSINLREQPSYDFMGIGNIMKFQIVVGKSEVVKEKLSEINMPKQFSLGNNYPNPFNPATTIPVEIPSASNIELKIYNILGQNIKNLFEGKVEAGRYIFTWDGRDETGDCLSSGVYLLHLNSDTGIALSNKMILLR
jgi:hypothetical protein